MRQTEKKQSKGEKMTEKTNYEIIDDYLPQKEFQEIQTIFMETSPIHKENIGWIYTSTVADKNESKNWKYFYMNHMICFNSMVISPFFDYILPALNKLDVKSLIRIKCNLFPNSEKVHEHDMHIDFDFSHKGAILYINSCNGYTKLEDGTKIDSVANRILFFDPSTPHCSTTTSDTTARFNINFNYF